MAILQRSYTHTRVDAGRAEMSGCRTTDVRKQLLGASEIDYTPTSIVTPRGIMKSFALFYKIASNCLDPVVSL